MAAKPRPIEEILIQALAAGASRAGAARAAGCSTRTVHRRLEDPEFARKVTQARTAALDDCFGRLTRSAPVAIKTLENLLKVEDSPGIQLGAAKALLEALTVFRRDVSFEGRLQELEQAAQAISQGVAR